MVVSSGMQRRQSSQINTAPTLTLFQTEISSPRVYRAMSVIAVFQLAMWGYLSYFSLTWVNPDNMVKMVKEKRHRKKPASQELNASEGKESRVDKDTNQGSKDSEVREVAGKNAKMAKVLNSWLLSHKSRVFLSILCMAAGCTFCAFTFLFPWRMVKSVTIVRATQTLQLVTGTPLGTYRTVTTPLSSVTCLTDPTNFSKAAYIMLRVKGHYVKFLLNYKNAEINPWFKTLVLSQRSL